MMRTRRPAGSKTEEQFITDFLRPLGMNEDTYGNLWLRIGDDPVMWSSHTDTVHHVGGHQLIDYYGDYLGLSAKSESNCLGADDTAGVWLMREMILAGKPGLYIFHREEEIGGRGSSWIARNNPQLLDGIKIAIALDRRGKTTVITHQYARCCSDEFAESLAAELGMGFKADSTGLFTDTANYTELIPECTNLSVGYEGAHSSSEVVDVVFLFSLLDTLLALDTSKLIVKRDPLVDDDWEDSYYGHGGRSRYSNMNAYDWETHFERGYRGSSTSRNRNTIVDLVRSYPEEVAEILEHYGIDYYALEDEILERSGNSKLYA